MAYHVNKSGISHTRLNFFHFVQKCYREKRKIRKTEAVARHYALA